MRSLVPVAPLSTRSERRNVSARTRFSTALSLIMSSPKTSLPKRQRCNLTLQRHFQYHRLDLGFRERLQAEIDEAEWLLTLSSFQKRTFMDSGVRDAKIITIPLGVDLGLFRPRARPERARLRIVFVGQLTQRKGLSYLLDGFRLAELTDAELILVGKVVSSSHPWEAYSGVSHIAHVARWHLPRIYQDADVFVLRRLSKGSVCPHSKQWPAVSQSSSRRTRSELTLCATAWMVSSCPSATPLRWRKDSASSTSIRMCGGQWELRRTDVRSVFRGRRITRHLSARFKACDATAGYCDTTLAVAFRSPTCVARRGVGRRSGRGSFHRVVALGVAGVLACLPLASVMFLRRLDVFEPIHLFALSFFVLFVVRPAFDLAGHRDPPLWFGYILDPTYRRALLVGIVGASGFYLGYWARVGIHLGQRVGLPSGRWSQPTLRAYLLVAVLVSVLVLIVFVSQVGIGSFLTLLKQRNYGTDFQSTSGYLYTAPLWLTSLGSHPCPRRAMVVFECLGRLRSDCLFADVDLGNGDRSSVTTCTCDGHRNLVSV